MQAHQAYALAKRTFLSTGLVLALSTIAAAAASDAGKGRGETKNVTVITAGSQADGGSEVRNQTLVDCIVSLPSAGDLEADVKSQSIFLREVNGQPGRNEWIKTYTATVEIPYMVYQKELVIVTTRSVQGQEPVLKEYEKRLRQVERFESDSDNGDIYAGRSDRKQYFSTSEGAVADAKKRASTWLRQRQAVLCRDGK